MRACTDVADRERHLARQSLLDAEFSFVRQRRNEVGIEAVEALRAEVAGTGDRRRGAAGREERVGERRAGGLEGNIGERQSLLQQELQVVAVGCTRNRCSCS